VTADEAVKEVDRLASLARDWPMPDGVDLMIQEHHAANPCVCYVVRRGEDVLSVVLPAPCPRANRERVHGLLDRLAEQLGRRDVVVDGIASALEAIVGKRSHVLDTAGMGVG